MKWFNNEKGYGFIAQEAGEDVFVHYSQIESDGYRSLTEGQRVEFEVTQGNKGLSATGVRSSDARIGRGGRPEPKVPAGDPRYRSTPWRSATRTSCTLPGSPG